MLFIEYPKCSTCRKAFKYLKDNNKDVTVRNIVEETPTKEELLLWMNKSGFEPKKFFNTSGKLYKEMQLKDKLPTMTDEEQLKLLSTDGMLVKRPLVIGDNFVITGFKEAEWEEKLK